jgi:SPP1 family predicted phage head-tail adaptor
MRAGTLRHRITVEHNAQTRDDFGGVTSAWAVFASSVPAAILPVSGREFFAAEASQAEVTTKIIMRDLAGLLPSMRIVHAGQQYNIRAILPDATLARHIICMCERVDVQE